MGNSTWAGQHKITLVSQIEYLFGEPPHTTGMTIDISYGLLSATLSSDDSVVKVDEGYSGSGKLWLHKPPQTSLRALKLQLPATPSPRRPPAA